MQTTVDPSFAVGAARSQSFFRQIYRPIGSLFPKSGVTLAGPFFVPA
jgi:hypothetical protein